LILLSRLHDDFLERLAAVTARLRETLGQAADRLQAIGRDHHFRAGPPTKPYHGFPRAAVIDAHFDSLDMQSLQEETIKLPIENYRGQVDAGNDRVLRGGSCCREPDASRSANRLFHSPDYVRYDTGFRVARTQ